MKKNHTLILLFLLVNFSLFSQISLDRSVIAMSGGYFENKEMTLSFTAGQYFTETVSNNNDLILTQGFQQPDGSKKTTQIQLPGNTMVTLTVFPNPVKNNLNIYFLGEENMDVKIEVFDVLGKSVLAKTEIANAREQMNYNLDFQSLVSGLYIVHISNTQKELNSTFKITKIN